MRNARPRCAASRTELTRGSSTRPLFTMYQPSAPCSPPSAKIPASFHASGRSMRPRAANIQERQQEDRAHDASQQPMEILPPEDALEARERHVVVAQAEFGRQAVLGERLVPLRVVERRQRAHDGLPLDDRESGMREARHAAHHDHREHERAAGEQPGGDRRVA